MALQSDQMEYAKACHLISLQIHLERPRQNVLQAQHELLVVSHFAMSTQKTPQSDRFVAGIPVASVGGSQKIESRHAKFSW